MVEDSPKSSRSGTSLESTGLVNKNFPIGIYNVALSDVIKHHRAHHSDTIIKI
jgi:hypothetical protein